MKRIFTVLLLGWLALQPNGDINAQCPTPFTQYEVLCVNNTGKIILTAFDISGYSPDSLTFAWSNGAVEKHPNTSTDNQLLVTGATGGLTDGSYSVTISDDDGCTSIVGPIAVECNPNNCDHLSSITYECTFYPNEQVDVQFTVAIWDVDEEPDTPYTFNWSNGPITLGTFIDGIYRSGLFVPDFTGTISVTITDDEGCSWVQTVEPDCTYNPPTSLAYECVNEIATITAVIWEETYLDSTLTFTWNTGEVTPMLNISGVPGTKLLNAPSGNYALEIETAGGNVWTEEISVDCEDPNLGGNECGHIIGYSYSCQIFNDGDDVVTVSSAIWDVESEPTVPYQFIWSTGDTSYSNFDLGFLFTEVSLIGLDQPLFVTITDDQGCTWTDFVEINCMYPGDTDQNLGVNHYDLLNIGLGYTNTGLPRTSASIEWLPQSTSTWPTQTPETAVNYAFADTDGNGQVEDSDLLAIEANWGKVSALGIDVINDRDLPQIGDEAIPFYVEATEMTAGQAYSLPVMLGNSSIGVEGAYGVAFSIEYDSEIFDPENIVVNFADSWLGELGADMLAVERNFPEDGRIDIAITRTDGQPVNGAGAICALEIIVIEDVIFMEDTSEALASELTVTGAMLINEVEEKLTILPMSTPVDVMESPSFAHEKNVNEQVQIAPNPANNFTTVFSDLIIKKIELFSTTGESLSTQMPNAHRATLSLSGLPAGIYLIHVQTEDGVAVKKLQLFSDR